MFKGKIALVTGASRGIGRETAKQLAAGGAYVIVNYAGSREAAESVVAEIIEAGGNAEAYQCNVGDFDGVKEMVDYIAKEHKVIDIVVNNAGITKDKLLVGMNESDFDDVINVNLKGTFNVCKSALRYMLKNRSGCIVNMASIVGISGNKGQANYSASKAGVIGFTKSIAKEVASRGIRINAIAPGFIETDMTSSIREKARDEYIETIPMKRLGTPEDIAKAVCFLASENAGYITGQILNVCGGLNM